MKRVKYRAEFQILVKKLWEFFYPEIGSTGKISLRYELPVCLFPFLRVGVHRDKKNLFMGCTMIKGKFWETLGCTAQCLRPFVLSHSFDENLGQKLKSGHLQFLPHTL